MKTRKNSLLWSIFVVSLIAGLVLLLPCAPVESQVETSFTPTDRFNLESLDGTISFGLNGTYSRASLVNDTWVFENLRLNGSQPLNTLRVSAKDSSIIVNYYRTFNLTLRGARLRYVVQERGQQSFNIGIAAGEGRWGFHPEWSVIVDGVWLGEGDGWTIKSDGTLTVTGVAGNVSIVYYSFMRLMGDTSDLSFYEQHSLSIATITLTVIVASIGVVIRVKTRKKVAPP